jgi:hypothetical protein
MSHSQEDWQLFIRLTILHEVAILHYVDGLWMQLLVANGGGGGSQFFDTDNDLNWIPP